MKRKACLLMTGTMILILVGAGSLPAADTVATAVYSRVSKGYKRVQTKDGSFKPEYYVMTNGGRIEGTGSDITVDRVPYVEVAEVARQVLAKQNYQLAQTKEQAQLLLVLNWGNTIAPNGMHQQQNVASLQEAMTDLGMQHYVLNNPDPRDELKEKPTYEGQDLGANARAGFNRDPRWAKNEEMAVVSAANSMEASFIRSLSDDQVRDRLNERNARVLGYLDDLSDSNDIRRHAGGGDRYNDLIGDVEESRYYIIVSAYDFPEMTKHGKKKLLWQTRVSVRSPGNSFNDSYLAMLKNASLHFGQDTGKLVRGEEVKGTVELGELKFLGEAKGPTTKEELFAQAAKGPQAGDETEASAQEEPAEDEGEGEE